MITINFLDGVRPPLPPATLMDILVVSAAALGFCAVVAGAVWGAVYLLAQYAF
jgi:hypothetical protein